jgi:hypothetical protein
MTLFRPVRPLAALLSAIALATPSGASRAQEPRRLLESESVPLELAAALVAAGGFSGEPQLLVGAMPEWIANRLFIPTGAHVLGSAFLGTTVVGVITVGDAPDTAIANIQRQLLQRGWTNPPPPPTYGGGGFRPAPVAATTGPVTRITLCGDQQLLTVSGARRRGAITNITFRVVGTMQYSVCRPPQMSTSMIRPPFPTLYDPANAADGRMTGDCSTTIGGSSGTGTTLRTSMTTEAILDHYAKQIRDSGWTPFGDKAPIVGRSWTRTDSTGAPIEMSLTVNTSTRDPSCHDLNLQVRTLRKP